MIGTITSEIGKLAAKPKTKERSQAFQKLGPRPIFVRVKIRDMKKAIDRETRKPNTIE